MSSLSSYATPQINKSYVVLKWIESEEAPKGLPVALIVIAQSIRYGTLYTLYPTDTDNILIDNLKPYDTYSVCFLPVLLRGKLESNCNHLSKTFMTAEGGK